MITGKVPLLCAASLACLLSLAAANQVYKWNSIHFKDLTRDVDTIVDGENVYYKEDNVIMSGFDYDMETGHICGAFPRIKPSVPVTVGCFNADEYDRMDTPKFSAFPTVADNDLPDWPEAQLPLGQARRLYNYRQSRGRKNITAYYVLEDDNANDSEDDVWMRGGLDGFRILDQDDQQPQEQQGKGFTGFSGLANLLLKKDKKQVVVAVVDDRDKHKHTPYDWSSVESSWRPYKRPQKPKRKEQLAYIVVPNEDQHDDHHHSHHHGKKQKFFRFFSHIGNKFHSVFKKGSTDQKPVYHVNVNHYYDSKEDQHQHHHHKPTPHHHHHHHSSEEISHHRPGFSSWYSSEESDERWSPIAKPDKKKPQQHQQHHHQHHSSHSGIPLYYEGTGGSYGHNSDSHKNTKRRPQGSPLYFDDSEEEEGGDHYRPNKHDKNPFYFDEERNLNSDKEQQQQQEPNEAPLQLNKEELAALLNKENNKPVIQLVEGSEQAEDEEEDAQKKKKKNPILINRPFNFISVHNVRFDKCGRLWFLDVGTVETAANPIFYHNPILWAFEVKLGAKEKLISRPYLRYELEGTTPTGLRSLIVDIHESCDDYHVYMPNTKDNTIVVYSSENGEHWQFENPTLGPVMKENSFTIQDTPYEFTGGVSSLTMGPRDIQGFSDVYYTPAAGTGQFKVSTHLLREQQAAPNQFNPKSFKFIGYRGEEGLTRVQVYDTRTDVLFSASVEDPAIRCWNTKKILTPDNYGTAYSNLEMVFGADIKLDRKGNLWSLANKMPIFMEKGLDTSEVNFSLYRIKPRDVIKGTVCGSHRRDRTLAVSVDDMDKRFDAEVEKVEDGGKEGVIVAKQETPVTVTENVEMKDNVTEKIEAVEKKEEIVA